MGLQWRVLGWSEGASLKLFACGDVVPGCRARWVCSSEDEVLVSVAAHAAEEHGLDVLPEELVDAVRNAIVAVN